MNTAVDADVEMRATYPERLPRQPKAECWCDFCGKSQHDVVKLIAGPEVYICNECVALCCDIINEERPQKPTAKEIELQRKIDRMTNSLNTAVANCLCELNDLAEIVNAP